MRGCLVAGIVLWLWCQPILLVHTAEEGEETVSKRRRWQASAHDDSANVQGLEAPLLHSQRPQKETTETTAHRHHKHERHRASAVMQHRAPLSGLPMFTSKEGYGRRYPRQIPHPERRRIPKIFHQIYVGGHQAYRYICQNPKSQLQCFARDSCLMYLQDWEQHFWNLSSIEALLQQHYTWALPMFNAYDVEVKRADVGRIFILHHYGGLYLDIDCQCYRDPIDTLTDYDFVIQGSGFEGVNNGMMASAPGLPLWQTVAQILEDRATPTGDAWKDGPIFMTGPRVLGQMFLQSMGVDIENFWRLGFDGGVFHHEQYVVKVYPMSTWFMPCWISDPECRAKWEVPDPEIAADLTQIVGYHQFASIWG